jgi:hypothetical protein
MKQKAKVQIENISFSYRRLYLVLVDGGVKRVPRSR